MGYFLVFILNGFLTLFISVVSDTAPDTIQCYSGRKANIGRDFLGEVVECQAPMLCLAGNVSINKKPEDEDDLTWHIIYDCETESQFRFDQESDGISKVHRIWTCNMDKCNDPRNALCYQTNGKGYAVDECLSPQCVTNKPTRKDADISLFDTRESYYCSPDFVITPFEERSFGTDRVEIFCYNADKSACNEVNPIYTCSSLSYRPFKLLTFTLTIIIIWAKYLY